MSINGSHELLFGGVFNAVGAYDKDGWCWAGMDVFLMWWAIDDGRHDRVIAHEHDMWTRKRGPHSCGVISSNRWSHTNLFYMHLIHKSHISSTCNQRDERQMSG